MRVLDKAQQCLPYVQCPAELGKPSVTVGRAKARPTDTYLSQICFAESIAPQDWGAGRVSGGRRLSTASISSTGYALSDDLKVATSPSLHEAGEEILFAMIINEILCPQASLRSCCGYEQFDLLCRPLYRIFQQKNKSIYQVLY